MITKYRHVENVLVGFATCIVFAVSMLLPTITEASLITIDASDYADGTDLSKVSPFVTLESGVGGVGEFSPITAKRSSDGGGIFFGGFSELLAGTPDCEGCFFGFGMTFDKSPQWLSLSGRFSVAGKLTQSSLRWLAFDASGEILRGGLVSFPGYEPGQFVALNITVPNMSALVVGGDDYPSPGDFDRLSFAVHVPEPSTMVLTALGLAPVFFRRRLRRF